MIERLAIVAPGRLKLFGVAIVALVLLAAWLYLLAPAVGDYRRLAAERSVLESTVRSERAAVTEPDRIARELEEMAGRLRESTGTVVPTRVMAELRAAAEGSGAILGSVVPQREAPAGPFEAVGFDVEVRGSYRQLAGFAAELETRAPQLAVTGARFAAAPDTDAVTLKLRVTGYRPARTPELPR